MKLSSYLIDKSSAMLIIFFGYLIVFFLFIAFQVSLELIIGVFFVLMVVSVLIFGLDYWKKKQFYDRLIQHTHQLDQKYLVLEMLHEPQFYDGRLLYQILHEINKSMIENVKALETSQEEFKEYIELWIHEIKLPISSLTLMNHNYHMDKRYQEQIRRIDDYVDQVLYYVRCQHAEKDYLIKETSLKKVIHDVALKNKNDLLVHHIRLIVEVKECVVLTDSKWLEFIIAQIISNSIKYRKADLDAYIKLTVKDCLNGKMLIIEDNGIGISPQDIQCVFAKTFTGKNGRLTTKSTGMGLYIVKKLCDKLVHRIEIESQEGQRTKVMLTFYDHDFYKMKD